jgi:transposase
MLERGENYRLSGGQASRPAHPPALNPAQQDALKAAVQRPPQEAGIDLADWNWKVVRRFVAERFGITLTRSSCHNSLHRLGFVLKRPKKRLLKADAAKREAFVATYATLRSEAQTSGAKHFFVDEAHFYADVDLRGKWVLKGTPALVDSTSPRYGEKASYYSAVCLETGEVRAMPLEGNSNAETSVAFLRYLRAHYTEPLVIFWDNAPAHGGDPLRAYLGTPDLRLRLLRLPAYSPDFNADEQNPTLCTSFRCAGTTIGRRALRRRNGGGRRGSLRAQTPFPMAAAMDAVGDEFSLSGVLPQLLSA